MQGRGELRRELSRCLRSGQAQRHPNGRIAGRGQIQDNVMISERPGEAKDRSVPDRWEGGLIIGKNNGSAVGTLVERSTRYVILLHLRDGREAEKVNETMQRAISGLPAQLLRSITWDQGSEARTPCELHHRHWCPGVFLRSAQPWQRGSNENTNGPLRQYMPKGTDLSVHCAEDLAAFARSLSSRRRQTLGWVKPSEKLAEFLAMTG